MTEPWYVPIYVRAQAPWAQTARWVARLRAVVQVRLLIVWTGYWKPSDMDLWAAVMVIFTPWEYVFGHDE